MTQRPKGGLPTAPVPARCTGNILPVVILTVICGSNNWTEIEQFGHGRGTTAAGATGTLRPAQAGRLG